MEDNRADVICRRPEGAELDEPAQDPLAVLAAIVERNDEPKDLAALAVKEAEAERVRSLATLFPVWQDLLAAAGRERWRAAVALSCGDGAAHAMVASDAWPALAARLPVLDASGIDSAARLAEAAAARTLAGAGDVAAVLHWRLRHLETTAALSLDGNFLELSPTGVDELESTIRDVAAAMDARSNELAARVEATVPAWACELGPIPADPDASADWRRRAGVVAGYREAFGLDHAATDENDPLGPHPTTGPGRCPGLVAAGRRRARSGRAGGSRHLA